MRVSRIALLGVLSLSATAWTACGGSASDQSSGSTTGTGGGATTTTGTDTTTSTDTTTTPPDAGPALDNGAPSDKYPAFLPAVPQVITLGGPVLRNPKFVPVFFAGDDQTYVKALTDYDAKIGATDYWKAVTAEYGVGPGTSTAPVMLTEAAPNTIDDEDIQTWLAGKLNGDDPAWPANDGDTVYVLHYPANTTITAGGAGSCTAFGGYHSNITLDATHGSADAAYAVIPRCTDFPPLSGIDAITGTESHELIEAATDPYPQTQPARGQTDNQHFYWERLLGGGEVGDMCAQFDNVWNKWPGIDYVAQSSWSNAAAKAGHDPCQPSVSKVYFNAMPVLKDNIVTTVFGQSLTYKGVKIPVGESAVVDLQLFSDGPTSGPFKVSVKDAQAAFGGAALLDIALDRNTGVNGEKLHATIKVKAAGKRNTETFIVDSELNGIRNVWIGIVGN